MPASPLPPAPVRPGKGVIALFAVGQFGWSLASYAAGNLLAYFYLPQEDGAPMFPTFVYQGGVLGVLTIVGLISFGGRIFDAATDPLIASLSDRSKARMGRRRFFMLLGALPFAASGFLLFWPPSDTSLTLNAVWLAAMSVAYYLSFTLYVIPYSALISELGHDSADRLRISAWTSVAWALGFVCGNAIYALQSLLEVKGFTSLEAFGGALGALQALALLALLTPAALLDEKRYAQAQSGRADLRTALRAVWSNANYRRFLFSDLLYWLALTFVQLGMAYYAVLLLGLDKSYAFYFALSGFVGSFALYAPVTLLALRIGKKPLMLTAYGVFAAVFGALAASTWIPLAPAPLLFVLGALSAWPLAIFGILPTALIADEAARDGGQRGTSLAGMYFASRTLIMKAGISLANLIFPSLLLLGKSVENPAGVRLSALLALGACVLSAGMFARYKEKR